jgi:hypothetical protein
MPAASPEFASPASTGIHRVMPVLIGNAGHQLVQVEYLPADWFDNDPASFLSTSTA